MAILQSIILSTSQQSKLQPPCFCDLVTIDVNHIPHDFIDNVAQGLWWSSISTLILYPKQSKTKQNSENIYWLHWDIFYIDINL